MNPPVPALDDPNRSLARWTALSFYLLSALTLATFALAMLAVPISGANAPGGGIPYPYLDTVRQYPRDYLWQYLAVPLMAVYLISAALFHERIEGPRKTPAKLSLFFAAIAAATLAATYYVQVSVVPASLMHGELDGMALITQYNPRGVFIALEEFGYLAAALSLALRAAAHPRRGRRLGAAAVLDLAAAGAVAVGLAVIAARFGLDKLDRFEVLAVSAVWLDWLATGVLLGNAARNEARAA